MEVYSLFFECINLLFESKENQKIEYFLIQDNEKNYYEAVFVLSKDENIISIVKDITERKKIQLELDATACKYYNLIQNSPNAIFINSNNKIVFVNNACLKIFGAKNENEILGKNPLELFDSAYHEDIKKRISILQTSETTVKKVEEKIVSLDGTIIDVEVMASSFLENGTLNIHVSLTDISERKKFEEILYHKEKRFRALIENSPDSLILINLEGKIKYVSPTVKMLGYTIEEFLKLEPQNFTHQEDLNMVIETITDVIQNPSKVLTIEYRFKQKDNTWIWIETTFSNMLNEPSIEAIILNSRSINDRKIVEENIKKNEEKYRFLIENILDVVWVLDVESLKLVFISNSTEKLTGYSVEETLKQTLEDMLMPESLKSVKEKIVERYDNFIKTGLKKIYYDEFEQICKDGSIVWVEMITYFRINPNSNRLEVIGTSRDISKRKEYEKKLKESEENYRNLIEHASDGIFISDMKGNYIDVNTAGCKMLKYPKEELLSKNFTDVIKPEALKIKPINFKGLEEGNVVIVERELLCKDETLIPVEISAKRQPNGKLLGIIRDISKRKEEEVKLKESEEKFFTIFNSIPDMLILTVISSGKILDVNERFLEGTKYTLDDVIGKTTLELNLWSEYSNREKYIYLLKRDGFVRNLEYDFNIKFGEKRNGLVSSSIITINNEKCILGTIRDITQHNLTLKKLKTTEDKFFKIFNSSPDVLVLSHISDGKIIEVNDKFLETSKYTLDEVIGKTPLELNFWEDLSKREHFTELLKQNGFVKNLEYDFILKSGEKRNALISASIINIDDEKCILGTIRDITEHNLALKKIKITEEKFFKIFKLTPDVIMITSINEGRIIEANNSFFSLLEYSPEESIGKTSIELKLWLNKEERDKVISMLIKDGRVENIEFSFISKSRKIYNCLISCEFIELNDEKYILSVIRNITEQKQIQNSLNNERLKLKTLIKTIPYLIWLKDLDGKYLFCNSKFEGFFGSKEEEIIGKTDFDFVSKEEAEFFREHDKKVITENKESSNLEWITYKCDGHREKLKTIKTPMYDSLKNIVGVLGVGIDITDLYNAQQEVHDREEMYSTIINQANNSIALIDIEKMNFIEFNEVLYKNLGYTKEEFKNMAVSDIEVNESPEEIKEHFELLKEKGGIFETKHKSKNGEIRDVRVSTKVIKIKGKDYLSSIWSDITESKKIEQELRDSANKLKEAQHIAKLGNWEFEPLTDNLFWSDEIYNIFGVYKDKTQMNYETFLNHIHPEDRDFVSKAYLNSLINQEPYDLIHRIIMKDNTIKYIHEKSFNQYNTEGQVIKSLGTAQDITDRVKIEEEIKDLNQKLELKVKERTEELENANKDLEAFAYSVSHDLRAPLRHIEGFSKFLKSSIKDPSSETNNFLNKINEANSKMVSMINDLLKFSRLGRKALEKTSVDLNILIKDIIESYKPDIENRKIEFNVGELPIIQGDYGLLQVVFENLISNAIKFTSKKEYAIIDIDQRKSCNKESTIYIRDNGAGFNMNYADKLFGVFQRLHSDTEFQGTGIGLANVKQILKKHGGSIYAESEENKGTTFYISI